VAASWGISNLPEEYKPVLGRAKRICQTEIEEYKIKTYEPNHY